MYGSRTRPLVVEPILILRGISTAASKPELRVEIRLFFFDGSSGVSCQRVDLIRFASRNCWCLIQFLGTISVQGVLLICYKQCLKVVVLLTFCFPLSPLRKPPLRALFGRLPSATSPLFFRFGGVLVDCAARTNFHKAAVRSGSVAKDSPESGGRRQGLSVDNIIERRTRRGKR